MRDFNLLINGRLVSGASKLPIINPATETVLAEAPRADLAQLNAAVAAAKGAFEAWAARPLRERSELLLKLAGALEARQDEFARLLTEEQGKPLQNAQDEIVGAIWMIRYFASLDLAEKVLKEDDDQRIVEQRTALGVVAAIIPWNYPMILLVIKVAPALLAGNTLVAKPAPTTPLTTLLFGELCAELLPPGVVNLIVDQNDLGSALTSHPDVAKVSFTGSTATGKKVMQSVAGSLKRLTLELGGNDAAIVLDDVDLQKVAPKIFKGATLNAGQICLAIKRLYVPDRLYDDMCDALAKLAREAIVDNGLKQGAQIGPVQNKAQFNKVLEFIKDARRHGKIVAGGEHLQRKGYFIAPTIVRDLPDDARLVREEQFGPVLPVLRYSEVDDAIARANDTSYGLGASVWSADTERALDVARRLDAGTVWINKHLDINPDVPLGGAKQSGMGAELGREGLQEYTQLKVINMAK